MKLGLVIHAALDLPRLQRVENRGGPSKKWVLVLDNFDALVELVGRLGHHGLDKRLASPMTRLGTHQNPNLLERLPLAIEGKQGAELEVARRDVERLRDLGPLLQVAKPRPARDAVIDDKQVLPASVRARRAAVGLLCVALRHQPEPTPMERVG